MQQPWIQQESHTQKIKRFYDKLDRANNTVLDLIFDQNQEYNLNVKVFEFRNKMQKSPYSYLGY